MWDFIPPFIHLRNLTPTLSLLLDSGIDPYIELPHQKIPYYSISVKEHNLNLPSKTNISLKEKPSVFLKGKILYEKGVG